MSWRVFVNALRSALPGTRRPIDDVLARQKVSEVLQLLQNGKFGDVRTRFVPPLQWILREPMLRKGWEALVLGAGPLVNVGSPSINVGILTTAKVPLEFERAKLAMVLQMNSSGRLTGLRFVPLTMAGLGPPWLGPDYASLDSFKEEEMTLGTGQYKVGSTLSMPKLAGMHPAIVLLGGSGPCDRDSTCEAVKPFKDLAWGLASRGVGVLRFDKVTHAHGSKFKENDSITLTDEYMDHALDAVQKLRRHPDVSRVYILGHSLGASVAPRIATVEPSIAGLIIMAGSAHAIYWAAIRQMRYLAALSGEGEKVPEGAFEDMERKARLADSPGLHPSTPVEDLPFGIGAPYWLDARTFDPINTTRRLQVPVLVLQGGRDYQVTLDDDFAKWHEGLEDHEEASFRVYEKLNHLFVAGEGPSTPREYESPGHVDEEVIQNLSDWILRIGKF